MLIQFVVEGNTPTAKCSKSQLDSWMNGIKIPFSGFKDVDGADFAIRTQYGERMTAYVLDRATRKILFKGNDTSAMAKLESL